MATLLQQALTFFESNLYCRPFRRDKCLHDQPHADSNIEAEPSGALNNSLATAFNLVLTPAPVTGLLQGAMLGSTTSGDEDWYRIELTNDLPVSVVAGRQGTPASM